MGSIEIGAKNKNKNLHQNSRLLASITSLFFWRLPCPYVSNYFSLKLRVSFLFLHFQNTEKDKQPEKKKMAKRMEERKLERAPNENPAGNLNTVVYCLQREKEGPSKMLILVQLSDSCLYPPQHLAYCFA